MNVLQHTRNERNPCLKQNRPDRSYRDTLLKVPLQDWLITDIIEINKVQFGLKSYAWFQIEQVRSASFIWSHKYDFRQKLHHKEFNYHFITTILKTQNSVAQIQYFLLVCTNILLI